jgi:hypothetical protein
VNIIEACEDAKLFRPVLKDPQTWRRWFVFVKAVYGLPLTADELVHFQQHTGRHTPREGGYAEAVCVVGCQSGKTQIAALVGGFEAVQAVVSGQRNLFVPLIAQDARAAMRALLGYVREAVSLSPVLSAEVTRDTAESIEFSGGVTLAVYPCRPQSIRGIRAACVIIDELAFFTATDGRPTDVEMLRAARSRVATTGGKILILSGRWHVSLHRTSGGRPVARRNAGKSKE